MWLFSSFHTASLLLLVCFSCLCFFHIFAQKQNGAIQKKEKKKLQKGNAKAYLEHNFLDAFVNNNNSSGIFPQDEREL